MTLPGASSAAIELEKLRDYCLDPDHPRGKHKARVFLAALGITKADSELLRSKILAAVPTEACEVGETDDYGARYSVEVTITVNDQSAVVCTGWIIREGEDFPRLTTCYVKG
jgi:hypothetical protein